MTPPNFVVWLCGALALVVCVFFQDSWSKNLRVVSDVQDHGSAANFSMPIRPFVPLNLSEDSLMLPFGAPDEAGQGQVATSTLDSQHPGGTINGFLPTVSSDSMSSLWDHFDAVFCTHLKDRVDRYNYTLRQFQNVGLLHEEPNGTIHGKMKYFTDTRHTLGFAYGSYDGHRQIIKKAYENGYQNVLIFEDDIHFGTGWENVVRDSRYFMQNVKDWDALFLGSYIGYSETEASQNNFRHAYGVGTHAYCVSRRGMEKFLEKHALYEYMALSKGILVDATNNIVWNNMYYHDSQLSILSQNNNVESDNNWVPTGSDRIDKLMTNEIMPKVLIWMSKQTKEAGVVYYPMEILDSDGTYVQKTVSILEQMRQVSVALGIMANTMAIEDQLLLLANLPQLWYKAFQ